MFEKNKFRAKVIENGYTLEEISKKIGINSTTLYRKMNGESDFTRSEIQMLRDLLGLDAKSADAIFFANELAKTQESL